MLGFERIIPNHAETRNRDVANGEPSFHAVMTGTVKNVGDSHRSRSRGCFQSGEAGGIVHHVVRQENFGSSARLEIACRSIVETAKDAHTGKQQDVGTVPEGMNGRRNARGRIGERWFRLLRGGGRLSRLRIARRLRTSFDCEQGNPYQPAAAQKICDHLGILDGNSEVQSYPCVPQ